ncbi:right-handed parallel beta-helix repeat-containing protein [Cellulophaga sp. 20_2_10]|uniref:right-handed parallel beta-helix repeat-containing protein n=1 Tax=Cellulophaga sp. 20_2_10 TaxID=2942476 RepID=UPI00201AF0D0|nr:right-handed parallel beta-helix repeat-containing protein [Cellulophaga sp. 20_2_10]MCL5244788.1 right-handed parallel beta-helix repeat-containing protein [Cellulophaga sp. 20_2_10]
MYKQPLSLVKVLVFSLLLIAPVTSCTQEDLLSNIIEEAETPEPVPEPDATAVDDLKINTTPCDYSIANLEVGTTLAVECQIDLKGAAISIPSGVTLEYKGGEIINGTLNFASEGKIDGNLLNHKLTIAGNVSLLSETFILHPNRWELVQGKTTSEIAQKNNDNLEDLMEVTQSFGATTFKIDTFDAYFEVSKVTSTNSNRNFYPSLEAVNIPSDFTLFMSDNTVLRVFPTENSTNATLLAIREVKNVNVIGGLLYGDRNLREYDEEYDEVGAHLLTVRASSNVILDGITMTMGSAGGVNIASLGFTFDAHYNPTNNVIVKNCVFDKVRRMSLVLTDGYNITIENNTFIDSSQPTANSDGGTVGYAINIEPVRKRDASTGEFIYYQKVQNVIIRGNKERGSRQGAFHIYAGDDIIIENNDLESVVSWSYASNAKIRNNTFTAPINPGKPAIIAGGGGETVFSNEISGNSITGYGVGISANYKNIKIFENRINNCVTGVQLKESADMEIFRNIINSSNKNSKGIAAHIANVNNVNIYENEISVASNPLYFVQLNNSISTSRDFKVNVFKNNFTTSGITIFSNALGVSFKENILKGGIQLASASKIVILNNIIDTNNSHGIGLRGVNEDIVLENNQITHPSTDNLKCIDIASTTAKNEVIVINNNCN